MEILTTLGVFLVLFGLIVFGAKYLLSNKTQEELKEIGDPVPRFYQSHNRMMARLIIVLALIVLVLYIVFGLR